MKYVAAILCLILLPVLMESCFLSEECGHQPKQFSIQQFTLQTVKSGQHVYEPAPPSGKPRSYLFVIGLDFKSVLNHHSTMGAYADCEPNSAIETITEFSATSSSELVTTDSTFTAGTDLTSVIVYEWGNDSLPKNRQIINEEFKFTPSFSVPSAQQHNFMFSITLSDGRHFGLQSGQYELLPE